MDLVKNLINYLINLSAGGELEVGEEKVVWEWVILFFFLNVFVSLLKDTVYMSECWSDEESGISKPM